ncbi:MAG: SLOG family protein [Oscillospiraceae bacterium]|nr:SLOG family protein [Oscillospiraceae bacterium]
MKEKACCFTGHRKFTPNIDCEKRLEESIVGLIGNGVCYFGCGGALGFDTFAAVTVLRLREVYPTVRLILVLPCPEQAKYWNASDLALYESIKARADKIVYASERYDRFCMQKRNCLLVDGSSYCICYLNDAKGGTASTVRYARQKGVEVINLSEE